MLRQRGCPRAVLTWLHGGRAVRERGRESGLSTVSIKNNGDLVIEDNR